MRKNCFLRVKNCPTYVIPFSRQGIIVALIFRKLLAMVRLTTHAVKLSINTNEPLFLLITPSTKSELKNKYKIGDKGDP